MTVKQIIYKLVYVTRAGFLLKHYHTELLAKFKNSDQMPHTAMTRKIHD